MTIRTPGANSRTTDTISSSNSLPSQRHQLSWTDGPSLPSNVSRVPCPATDITNKSSDLSELAAVRMAWTTPRLVARESTRSVVPMPAASRMLAKSVASRSHPGHGCGHPPYAEGSTSLTPTHSPILRHPPRDDPSCPKARRTPETSKRCGVASVPEVAGLELAVCLTRASSSAIRASTRACILSRAFISLAKLRNVGICCCRSALHTNTSRTPCRTCGANVRRLR